MTEAPLNRRDFLKKTAAAAGAAALPLSLTQCALTKQAASGGKRPNIILLFTDDQRWDASSWMGQPILKTPNQDRIAHQGVAFTNAFVTTAICCVSRATLLTGQYERRHKMCSFSEPIPTDRWPETFPALLRQSGYRTGFVGKWGLGGDIPKAEYDLWEGRQHLGPYIMKDGSEHWTKQLENHALRYLDGCGADKPFFLQVSFQAPHDPFQPNPKYMTQYEGVTVPAAKTVNEESFEKLPDFIKTSMCRDRWEKRFATPEMFQKTVKRYYGLINGADDAVGAIFDKLEEKGLADNTVIVYSSDNGFFLGEKGLAGKWLMYEESIRVPLMIYDPRAPQKQKGKRIESMALNVDLAPTILDYAGLKAPAVMQGRSLRPLAETGKTPPDWRTDMLYEHRMPNPEIPRTEGVRNERWKYTRYYHQNPVYEELFDLQEDPLEETNLANDSRYAAQLDTMRRRLEVLIEEAK